MGVTIIMVVDTIIRHQQLKHERCRNAAGFHHRPHHHHFHHPSVNPSIHPSIIIVRTTGLSVMHMIAR